MLTRRNLSILLVAVVLTFVTLFSCVHGSNEDWVVSTLPGLPDPGPDSMVVDTEGVVYIYNSSSFWQCYGNPDQGWRYRVLTESGVVSMDVTTEEDEVHSAYIRADGNVFYEWRRPPLNPRPDELVESFHPGSVERVEIERAPNGTLWLAVLYNDQFYLYEHTPEGWNDYVVETMPAQFKDQSLWRFEVDWNNQIHLVRQISPIGFYHIIGTPGDWSNAIINNIEEFPGDTREFEMTGMEMRKNNTPIIHVRGSFRRGESFDHFRGSIFSNEGDWEAAEIWLDPYGETAYDHARDRIHCLAVDYNSIGEGRYWSVPLGDDSRDSYTPQSSMILEGVACMTIGKLDLPHLVVWNGGTYDYYRPLSDIYVQVDREFTQADTMVTYGYNIANWKWLRDARVGFVMEIAGNFYWWPNWNDVPSLPFKQFDTGLYTENLLTVPSPNGEFGINVTFYTALLHPTQDILLNGAAWDMLTVTY